MDTIVVFGISHKTSPIEERERVSFGSTSLKVEQSLNLLVLKPSINECVIVSTCNRVEIYAACGDCERGLDEISDFLCELNERVRSDFLEKNFYFLEGIDAIRHLHRVAAGMDSMVIGEPQILGQLKRAYETAHKAGTAGLKLNKLFQSAFFTVKKIKNQTGVGSHMVSVSSVAVKLARNIFGEIEKCSVMVVGTGEAAAEAATQLVKRGVMEMRIAGRNIQEATKLASSLGGTTLSLGEINKWMRKTDIVISATSSSDYILKTEDITDIMKLRKNEPISLIDIAFPRDIDPKIKDIEGVFLYDMDDLQNIVDKNLDSLRKSLDEAEEMIKIAADKFVLWQKGLKAFPLIVEFRKQTEEMVKEETLKAISKINSLEKTGDCDKKKRDEILWSLVRRIKEKFLHKPVTKLKKEASNSREPGVYVEMARNLFELSGEDSEYSYENENWKQK